ncbi:hypothetical protein Tco_1483878 [Tanacetum coccineum]
MSYEDIRPIFERVWDHNQAFVPKDSEIEKEVMKRFGFNLQQEVVKKDEASSFAQKQLARGSRKKSLARKRARETLREESLSTASTSVSTGSRVSTVSNYPIWEVIQKGNGPVQVSTDTNGQIRVLPPKTAEEILAREKERKARTTLLNTMHKGYDWFKSHSEVQLEIHGARLTPLKIANQKVFEPDVKGSTRSSSSAQNVAFVSSSTSSTNDVSTAYGVSTSSGHNSQREGSSSYTDELM